MNRLLVLGVIINSLVAVALLFGVRNTALGLLMATFAALCVVGTVLVASGIRKPGAILVIVGSIGFVPIGLIALLGARKSLDQLKQEAFDARRRTAGAAHAAAANRSIVH